MCIIADDFTGAGDSAIQFQRNGFNAFLGLHGWDSGVDLSSYNVLVVSTESRFMDGEGSYRAVREAVKKCRHFQAEHFFKKIDSTIRGNVADEIAAVMDEAGYSCALVAPAAPKNDRTVVSGHCLIAGKPIGATATTSDLFTPVASSYVPDLFESRFPGAVGHIELAAIRKGPEAFKAALASLRGEGKKVVIADSQTIDDLRIVASVKNDSSILFSGASGLAEAMTREKTGKAPVKTSPGIAPESILFLVGSITETSRLQVERLRAGSSVGLLNVDIPAMLENEVSELSRIISRARSLPADRPVLIETLTENSGLSNIVKLARKRGLNEKVLGGKVSAFLAQIVTELFKIRNFQALFITGGDTAARTAESLGIKGIQLISEVLPGVPLGRFTTDLAEQPVYLISKAGGFGPPETLERVYAFLKTSVESETGIERVDL